MEGNYAMHCSSASNPRIVIYDVPNEYEGADVIKATSEQTNVVVGQCLSNFQSKERSRPIGGLETTPDTFHKLLDLGRLVIGWSRSKISEHFRVTVTSVKHISRHISKMCKNQENFLNVEGKCTNQKSVEMQTVKWVV